MPMLKNVAFKDRVDIVVNWLMLSVDITFFYLYEPDSTGHSYGPDSIKYYEMLSELDDLLGYLIGQLKAKKIYDKLNLIIVSDHGMSQLYENQNVLIGDYITNVECVIDKKKSLLDAVAIIYPTDAKYEDEIVRNLSRAENLYVYKRSQVPREYHFREHSRIGTLKIEHILIVIS